MSCTDTPALTSGELLHRAPSGAVLDLIPTAKQMIHMYNTGQTSHLKKMKCTVRIMHSLLT